MIKRIASLLIYRISILDRYLIKQFIGPFFLAVGGFSLVAIVDILMYLVDLVFSRDVSPIIVLRLLIYRFPGIMVMFFPMAVLFAIMLMLVRLAKDNELTVLRTSGIRTSRILLPVFLLLFGTTLMSFLINEHVVPWTNHVSDQLIRQEISRKPPIEIVEDVVFKVPGGRYFYIHTIDEAKVLMNDILIFERTHKFPRITVADTARWNGNQWTLYDGAVYDISSDGDIQFYDRFRELVINVDQAIQSFYKRHKSAKEMDSSELKERIQSLNDGGVSTRRLKVDYYMKFSVPFACFIFGLVGIAFCLTWVRSGKDWWGVIVAIISAVLVVGFYIFVMSVFKSFGKNGYLPPFWAAWTPNMIYGVISAGIIGYQAYTK